MQFAERFIRRPVLASMISLGLVLVGAIGYTTLPVREFPDADAPIVSVTVFLPGASPQVVESAVTDVLEEELSSVEGVRTMSVEPGAGQHLTWSQPDRPSRFAQDCAQGSRACAVSPDDVEEPVVAKSEATRFRSSYEPHADS